MLWWHQRSSKLSFVSFYSYALSLGPSPLFSPAGRFPVLSLSPDPKMRSPPNSTSDRAATLPALLRKRYGHVLVTGVQLCLSKKNRPCQIQNILEKCHRSIMCAGDMISLPTCQIQSFKTWWSVLNVQGSAVELAIINMWHLFRLSKIKLTVTFQVLWHTMTIGLLLTLWNSCTY